jgi:hypothetical protein
VVGPLKVWNGLVARIESRRDSASEKMTTGPDAAGGAVPPSRSLDTRSLSVSYLVL